MSELEEQFKNQAPEGEADPPAMRARRGGRAQFEIRNLP